MKAIRILFLALTIMMASGAMAQTVYNSRGTSCGKIESDGIVRNDRGTSIGKIDSDGTVRNDRGTSIGKASGIPREWVAAYFFFFFN